MNIAPWIVQGLLAAFFLMHALLKFVLPDGLPVPVNVVAFALAAFVAYGCIRLRPIAVTIQ